MKDVSSLLNRPHFQAGGGDGGGELPPDPAVKTRIKVNLDQVIAFQGNPRKSQNPAYAEIKESIRKIGLQNPPNVTRADPSHPYMIRDGGNTRLQILKELWDETHDRKFYEFECDFHPYSNHLDLLIKHVIENEMRGGMILIERGLAALEAKKEFEIRDKKSISNSGLSRELRDLGWAINDRSLSYAIFAAETILPVLPKALWGGMGRPSIESIRKLLDDCSTFWMNLPEHKDDPETASEEFAMLWQNVFTEEDDEHISISELQDALEGAIADYIGCPLMSVTGEIQAISKGLSKGGIRPESVLLEESLKPQASASSASSAVAPSNEAPTRSSTPKPYVKSQQNAGESEFHTNPASNYTYTPTMVDKESGLIPEPEAAKSFHEAADIHRPEAVSIPDLLPNLPPSAEYGTFTLEELHNRAYGYAYQISDYLGLSDLIVPGDTLAEGKPHVGFFMTKPEQGDYFDAYEESPELRQVGNYYRYLFFLSCSPLTHVPPREDTAPIHAMDLGWLTNWPTQVMGVRQLIEFISLRCQYQARPDPDSLEAILIKLTCLLEKVVGEILLRLRDSQA
ncbi:MAG TPA: hypothetical protein PKZ52_09860 [Cellvibrionaceae bacterium]|nr:hypothetical protein [Cellvibrionaceae bacterium]